MEQRNKMELGSQIEQRKKDETEEDGRSKGRRREDEQRQADRAVEEGWNGERWM